MRIRRFAGANVAEALRLVKEAMGDEALILARRDLGGGRVEITAGVDVDQVTLPVHVGEGAVLPGAGGLDGRRLDRLVEEIRGLGASLRWIEERLEANTTPALPGDPAGTLCHRLGRRGLAAHLAAPVAAHVQAGLAAGRTLSAAVEEALRTHLRLDDEARASRVMAFVGPTGSGKTTTIAKLAAEEVQRGQRAPALVMADTQRVGAGEQLAAYARLLGASVHTVQSPADLPRLFESLASAERILIDTGGVSGDPGSSAAVVELLAAVPEPVRVAAVFSATTSRSALEAGWRRLERLAPECCVVTRIDECDDPGAACGFAVDIGLRLAWLGTGPRVPQDLCAADGASLARCLLAA